MIKRRRRIVNKRQTVRKPIKRTSKTSTRTRKSPSNFYKTRGFKKNKAGWKQGWYTPKHPEKYIGDPTQIRYMSSWEHDMHKFLDNNINILQWSSETISIPYIKPTDKKVHYYYPDYWVKYKDRKGNIKEKIIELKPYNQTVPTKKRKPKERLIEQTMYAINQAKWRACRKVCDKYDIEFQLFTERDVFV